LRAIIDAVSAGRIAPGEGSTLASLVAAYAHGINIATVELRIDDIDWKLEKLLSKVEKSVSLALRKRAETQAASEDMVRPKAPTHATAVGAIVLYGEPKIDEPLVRAWARTIASPSNHDTERVRARVCI
jgi:hypothetical protein